jgi:hypothetical protein
VSVVSSPRDAAVVSVMDPVGVQYVVSSPRDAAVVVVMDPVGECSDKCQGCSCGGGNRSCGCM